MKIDSDRALWLLEAAFKFGLFDIMFAYMREYNHKPKVSTS